LSAVNPIRQTVVRDPQRLYRRVRRGKEERGEEEEEETNSQDIIELIVE
jgi:hypothetical protein